MGDGLREEVPMTVDCDGVAGEQKNLENLIGIEAGGVVGGQVEGYAEDRREGVATAGGGP